MNGRNGSPTTRICDVFIGGSGIVGSTFARLLVDAGAQVVMADAGDYHSRRAGENRKNAWAYQHDLLRYGHFVRGQMIPVDDANGCYPAAMVSYAVGGMAVHWTCAIPEFHESLERAAFIPSADWRDLYDKASKLLNRHVDVFSASVRHRLIRDHVARLGWPVRDTPMAAERLSADFVRYTGADTVLGPLAAPGANDRFEIIPEHCVQRLVRSPRNPHVIEYAEVRDVRTGEITRFHAETFVVAAGWLHTPQILWASDIQADEESSLGRYMSDHTYAACTVVLGRTLLDAITAQSGRTGSVPAERDAWGIPLSDAPPHLYVPVGDDRPWQGMIFRESFQFDADPGGVEDRRGIDLKWFGMIAPVRDNRVIFSREKRDRLGMPQASFRFRPSEADLRIQAAMMADMRELAVTLGPYRAGAEPTIAPLGSAIHATGLTRIGAADDQGATSVADPFCKVWGLDNLYVGGNCVLPNATAANPTLTSVALAIRAAESIVASGRCATTEPDRNAAMLSRTAPAAPSPRRALWRP